MDVQNPTNTKLSVRGLNKAIKQRQILKNVSLDVNQGEVVALLGPNGAGKTSCFHAIIGLVSPDSGTMHINGEDVTEFPMYRRARAGLGYLPQESSIFRGLTTEKNIRAAVEVVERVPAKIKDKVNALIDEFGLLKVRHAPAPALSGGERRRVEIARTLATNPEFIMLDEPFAGVDPIAVNDVKELVFGLKTRGMGVLITDHNVAETLKIVDRAYILFEGQVIASGTPEEIVANPDVRRVYLGEGFKL